MDDDNRYSIREFVQQTVQQDRGQGLFELESERILEVNLNGQVWTKMGSMIAYRGDVKFTREGMLEHGLGKLLKKAVTGEGARLTKAAGKGKVYLADAGKKISILNLQGEALVVNGNDLLAFQDIIKWDITIMRKVTAMIAGGLFNVRLEGTGMIAITSHYEPLTLLVEPGNPVYTDPNATIAWSGGLAPEFKTDVSLKTFFGRGSGESIQMKFDGKGFVVVQPFEELPLQAPGAGG
ncbi:MAG: AIM24 family protein [Planctomycetaceae bacterium]|nr:AIM24 family protein [Planctomycetaceae bacterium]